MFQSTYLPEKKPIFLAILKLASLFSLGLAPPFLFFLNAITLRYTTIEKWRIEQRELDNGSIKSDEMIRKFSFITVAETERKNKK